MIAAREELADRLCEIWAQVRGGERVEPSARLLALGSAPLEAVRFEVEVENRLGLRVPFECFFRAGMTVADLAVALQGRPAAGQPRQVVVPVQPEGSRLPVLFVHGDEYAMLSLRRFPAAFGPDRPLYGLLPERPNRRFDRDLGLLGLVPGLLRAVRGIQPAGPYHLCGHSLGGLLAYEIAGRLAAEGETVGWLALVDTQTPAALHRFLVDLMAPRNRLRRQLRRGLRDVTARAWEVAGRRLRARRRADAGVGPSVDFDTEGASAIYRASQVAGHDLPVDLYTTTDGQTMSRSRTLGWEHVHRGPLEAHECPGDHMTMLAEPNVGVLATMMAARLEELQARRR